MKTLIRIAFRNLDRQKKRSFLLGGAIAFGIMVVTVIDGFAGAFVTNVASNMASLVAGHVFVEGVEKSQAGKIIELIRSDQAIDAALGDSDIGAHLVQKRSVAGSTLVFAGKSTRQNIWGVDFANEDYLRKNLVLKAGTYEDLSRPRSLVLSQKTAAKLKAQLGDKILVRLKTINGQNNVGEFTLRGLTFDMGLFTSIVAYGNRDYLNELMAMAPDEYQMYGIMLPDLARSEKVRGVLIEALKKRAAVFELGSSQPSADAAQVGASGQGEGGLSRYDKLVKLAKTETWSGVKYRVFTINDTISQIEQLVSTLNMVSLGILAVLIFITMVGISNTFRMIMHERVREIGTMRALGMQRPEVRRLFLLEAAFLALGGTLIGMAAAGLVMLGLSFINFGTDTFFALLLKNGHLSFAVNPQRLMLNFGLVLGLTLLAALLPARKASHLEPAAALRSSK